MVNVVIFGLEGRGLMLCFMLKIEVSILRIRVLSGKVCGYFILVF